MNTYYWQSDERCGFIEAHNKTLALLLLTDQGITIKHIEKYKAKILNATDQLCFLQNLASLLQANLPILNALNLIAKTHRPLSKLCHDIQSSLENGDALHLALQKINVAFEPMTCALIQTGEATGKLPSVLTALITEKEKWLATRTAVKKALFYPCCVLLITMIIMTVMLLLVVPKFASIYAEFGAKLPWLTGCILAFSNWIKSHFLFLSLSLTCLTTGLIMRFKHALKMREQCTRLLLRCPGIRYLFHYSDLARLCQTIALCLHSGLALQQTLSLTENCVVTNNLTTKLRALSDQIALGESLYSALCKYQFPERLCLWVSMAEASGNLDVAFSQSAQYYQQKLDQIVCKLSQLIEPLMMLVLGLLIGGLLIALYLPLFQLGMAI